MLRRPREVGRRILFWNVAGDRPPPIKDLL